VQEEATKLSKRAKRRAAGEGSEEETGAEAVAGETSEATDAEGDAETGEDAGADAGTEASPNRQARRTAASKARARRKREREAATAIGLDAGEMVDDALVRFTDKVGRLLRRHANALQWVFGLGVIGWFGFQVYQWRRSAVNAEVSDLLFQGVEAEHGRIGDPSEQGKPNVNGIIDPTLIFETDAARLQAAADKYAVAANERPGQAVSGFASVARAGVLLEQGKLDEAKAGFDQVATSEGAKESPELRGAAIEGRALVLEAKADLPGALAAFEELAGVPGFENRALYQQARVKQVQGDVEGSKKLLVTLFKNIGAPRAATLGGLPERPEYLRQRATQLAAVVDPFEKDVKVPKPPMGADAVQQMLEQLKEQGVVTAPTPAP
jgi:tetratricopeptide (TPR) repeat protein